MASYSLSKNERLKGTKNIQTLFQNGKAFFCAPYRVLFLWKEGESEYPVQVLFSAPKKKFKTAVQRNRLRRQSREAYRTQKPELISKVLSKDKHLHIAFLIQDESPKDFKSLQLSMRNVFEKIES